MKTLYEDEPPQDVDVLLDDGESSWLLPRYLKRVDGGWGWVMHPDDDVAFGDVGTWDVTASQRVGDLVPFTTPEEDVPGRLRALRNLMRDEGTETARGWADQLDVIIKDMES